MMRRVKSHLRASISDSRLSCLLLIAVDRELADKLLKNPSKVRINRCDLQQTTHVPVCYVIDVVCAAIKHFIILLVNGYNYILQDFHADSGENSGPYFPLMFTKMHP